MLDPDTSTSAAVAAAEAGAAFERLRVSLGLPAVSARQPASNRIMATQLADVVSVACSIASPIIFAGIHFGPPGLCAVPKLQFASECSNPCPCC